MFDSIFIGMSGMEGFSKGLKVISNNVANLNTPGFKSSNLQFTDAFYQQGSAAEFASGNRDQPTLFGSGLETLSTIIDFKSGDTQQTSNPLDVSIGGDGFLVSQDKASGARAYTRDGQLQFNSDDVLVSTTTGKQILGYATADAHDLQPITLDGLKISLPKATSKVVFAGNVSFPQPVTGADGVVTTGPIPDVPVDVAVDDSAGTLHTLHLNLTARTDPHGNPTGTWTVTITDGVKPVGIGSIGFVAGRVSPSQDTVTFTYPPGSGGTNVTLDFSTNVTSFSQGNTSSLGATSQDGYAAGTITKSTFDESGVLTLTYSNGQTATGAQLALAQFRSLDSLQQQGRGEFTSADPAAIALIRPNTAGSAKIAASQFEMSNVDLSGEFSNLIVMQRGYQASSNILSTANDMLQELFDMRGGR